MKGDPCDCPGCRKTRFGDNSPFCPFCDDSGLHFHCSKCDGVVVWPKLPDPGPCPDCGAPLATWPAMKAPGS